MTGLPAFALGASLAALTLSNREFPVLPAGLATTASGLQHVITEHGSGLRPIAGQVIIYHYKGTLADGTVFDSTHEQKTPFAFTLGKKQVIKGVEEAFLYF